MVSGIASKAGNNATLMAILSFPVIIPILLMAIRISKNALDGLDWSVSVDKLIALAAINAIVAAAGYILFRICGGVEVLRQQLEILNILPFTFHESSRE